MKLIRQHLYIQVLIAIFLGVLVGLYFPKFADGAKVLSDIFINLIRMLIAPIIFFTIVLGIAKMGDMKKVGRVGGKALLYFEIITTLAITIGIIIANISKPGEGISIQKENLNQVHQIEQQAAAFNWGDFFLHSIPSNIVEAFAKGDILQVLFFAVLFGWGITKLLPNSNSLIQSFEKLSNVFFVILKFIMKLAPIGAFGGMAYTVGHFGLKALIPLGKLMLCVYATMAIFIFGVLWMICRFYGVKLLKYLHFIRSEILIVLGTSSSESALPGMMEKMEQFGCSRSVVGLVIPTGYSFNLDGTSIYLSMAAIFLAQVSNVDLSITQQLTIIGILMLTSKGAAGITGSGFIVLASTLAAVKVIPIEGLTLLLGVDRFMSEARAITNLIGNGVATIVIAKHEKEFDEELYQTNVLGQKAA
ncbi:aerobic C4-dicarboxylate transport protein [Chitinophaga skermanii]|uniref:Aerobic C4-dicarboxylate transport protein n=1 Tax=Chitinophaga skermanii TaxID=331697 RepID=A0A327QR63_9BACT|nr:C4-dicarboxylate transporter DctA [Chitinophaga skermanii]RAJ04287.1 aerobic C4-dicarboxylate transport protein [Chitinophaga skermanii]